MARRQSKRPIYRVEALVSSWVSIEISAGSLQDAVEIAQGLKPDDFVESLGDLNDNSIRIVGVSDGSPWDVSDIHKS